MKKLFVSILLLAAGAVWSQDDSVPGRSQVANNPGIAVQVSSGAQPLFQPELMPITQSSSAIAEAITPDIQSLADNLGGNPTLIFNYVHDQIRYVHYFGSKKGAELTLLERSGNDFDQCALLAALLQASGYPTEYQFGWMKVPYDNPANQLDLHHWLCLSLNNTNWNYTLPYLQQLSNDRGFYTVYYFAPPDTNDVLIQHIVVTTTIGETNYYLDPSLKASMPVAGTNLSAAIGVSSNTLWTAAGGTNTGTYVSGLSESALRTSLQSGNSNLLAYISSNIPNATVAQVIGGQQIVSSSGLPLSTSLNYPFLTNTSQGIITVNWTNQPTNFMGTFTMTFAGTNKTWLTPELEGQRVSLIFDANGTAQLWQEDSPLLQTTNTGTSNMLNVIFTATHPYGSWNTAQNIPIDTGINDYSSTNAYLRTNATYAIMYGFEANQAWLKERQQMLNTYIQEGLPSTSREVTTETLNVMGLGWMVQTELAQELLSHEWGLLPENFHRFGRMAQEAGRGYYIDVYLQLDGTYPATGYSAQDITNENQVFDVGSYFWSAMEHGIIEQLQNSNLVAASTVKMIEVASTNSHNVYLANSGNWTTVRSSLVNYGVTTNTLSGLVSSGFTLLLPQNGSNLVIGTSGWAGYGYVQLGILPNGVRAMGMIIKGEYNGGYVNDPTASVDPPYVNDSSQSQPTYFNPQPITLQVPTQLGADPINMVDGTFQITSTDLAVGHSEPRGLNLTRYYSSERINSNPSGMAPGWLHSYYCNANAISDPEGGLGTETVEQMSPMIVATYTALNLYNNIVPDPKNWTVTALIAKWGVDQLIDNAVTINLGNQTIQFTKEPNGSYTPPPNCTMSLISTNGTYWLQERHGRTFKFNTKSVLTNIVDQYGQSMKLFYNSNNLVTNVTDWVNRSLTFTYTGGALTSVTDSTGRSVSYGYTGGELTSYTDPEHKNTTYAYDTNNELVATFDALNNLVESNYYDGFGHVTTQMTEGNTNKTWNVLAAGYYTTVIDPAGDETVYAYDNKSRLIAYQDGMGNITQTSYDGQDHVAQTVSPLNETNQFIYDGSNNMTEAIDSLGHSNVFTYDANNNLIAFTDRRGNTNHFGYNGRFSLVGSTNGNGDYFTLGYNTDGTLHTRTDSVGTTTYGYDTNGTLNNIAYQSPLGSESFVNNPLGDPMSHTDVRNFTNTFAYNNRRQLTNTIAPTNLTTKMTFDANANLSTMIDPRGYMTSNNWSTTRKLLTSTMPATPQGSPVVTSTYDNRDWLASTQNPLGKTLYYSDDAAQRLIATIDPLQRTNRLAYDNDSHQTSSTDAAGDLMMQFWDARGNMMKIVDAATNIVGKTYDAANNLIYLTNRNGNVWTFQYDGANRLANTISPLNHSSSQIYNNRGLLQSSTDPLHRTTTFGYDARGRMTSKADGTGTTTYNLDLNGNLTNFTENGQFGQQAFDAYNRLSSYTDVNGYTVQHRYDANGNITNIVYPGNLTVKYYYDSNNRLTNITDWSNRQTGIVYDLAGHVTSVSRPNNTVRLSSYDDDGELTNIVERTTTQFPIAFYTLNYNLAGRVQWEFKGPPPHTNTVPTRNMTFDADNRLATFNTTGVSVDDAGNLTYGPGTNNTFGTYAYDAQNRLTNAGGMTYGYDPANNRTSVTNGGSVSTYVIDPQSSQVLMRITGGITNYYVYGTGLLYEIDVTASSTSLAFYHFDSRGSTAVLTDGNGNPTDGIEYSPYGTTTYRFGTNTTPFLYNGQFGVQTDPNVLLYMRARYYNPYISRFINADPSGFGGGLNFYAFCNDNPINAEDPFGLWGWTPDANQAQNYWMGVALNGAASGGVIGNLQAAGSATMTSFIGFFGAQNVQNTATLSGLAAGHGNPGAAVLFGAATVGEIGLASLAGWTGGGGAAAKGVGLADLGSYELGSQTINGGVYGALDELGATANKVELGQWLVGEYGFGPTVFKTGDLSPTLADWGQTLLQGPTPGGYVFGNLGLGQALQNGVAPAAIGYAQGISSSTGK